MPLFYPGTPSALESGNLTALKEHCRRIIPLVFDIILLLLIVAAALVLFIDGRLRVDLVGLLVLSALALTGLVNSQEALAGFSSPAVVTVWALFILSTGLTRTGIAHQIGKPLQKLTKGSEAALMVVLMVFASLLSALINTITVAAILLPSTMELARRSGRPPSRLLMPLALGCLLGGPFTGISTPPNILITDALRNAGLEPFAIFDFTPITGMIVAAGIVFMVLIGRFLLPSRSAVTDSGTPSSPGTSYQLDTHIFTTRIPRNSPLDGRTLAESRLGSALYLTVLALQRKGTLILAPRPNDLLASGDILIVHGSLEYLKRLHASQHLQIQSSDPSLTLLSDRLHMAEASVADGSPLINATLAQIGLRREYCIHVIALFHPDGERIQNLQQHRLAPGDRLVIQGEQAALKEIATRGLVTSLSFLSENDPIVQTVGGTDLLPVRVPSGSVMVDRNLIESRLGNAFGLTVIAMVRDEELICLPSPQETIRAGDLLILQGAPRDLAVMEGLQNLEISEQSDRLSAELESQQIGVTEVLLSPRTRLANQTLADLLFRERYGISVLAIWRKGRPHRAELQDMPLQFGDALLVYGQRRNLEALARDPDFLVLDEAAAQAPRMEKSRIAVAIMSAVILSAISGMVPISIAALAGASLMVLTGCLSMEEAYRAIEWKVVFLIAGMLPLGAAIENTGVAQMGASALIGAVGDLGPRWVVAALFTVTVIGTQIIPTAALVVLMAPVALSTADTLGISPHLLMMTVAISASSSFASPLSHPAHLLVMGPGGYRFMDYVKVGVPITILALLISVGILPVLWPPH